MKKILFVFLILFAFACKQENNFTPREINFDRDICALCLMGLAEQEYSVQLINKWGKVVWFDDIGCYVNYVGSEDWKRFVGDGEYQAWIGNCETGEWLDVNKAYYRYGDHTPMGYGYGAIPTAQDSAYDYATMAQRIKDGKSMRDQFMKMHKMGKGMKMKKHTNN